MTAGNFQEMHGFHTIVRPGDQRHARGTRILRGCEVATYAVDLKVATSFLLSYEALADILHPIPRLFLEPDGSFVWVSDKDPDQKLNGQITDDGQRVMFIELRGSCSFDGLVPVLAGLGWPSQRILFQWLPEAALLDEHGFRTLLAS